ncbi:MAG: VaFE repeat-containing surface-anchored protein [Coprococcus eutactus]
MKKTWKRLCTGFLALATVVTALPTTPVHAESKQYWTESKERVGIVEKVMNDGSIGSTFNEGHLTVEGEDAYCIDINTDFKNGYKTRADASSRMSADQISNVALSLEYVKQYGEAHKELNYKQVYLLEQCVVWQRLSVHLGWQCDNVRASYDEIPKATQDEVFSGAKAFVKENKGRYECGGYIYSGEGQELGQFWAKLNVGNAKLQKTSSNNSITDGNGNYYISGATYGVFSDKDCTADSEAMKVEVAFTFDATSLDSKQLVTFEELYDLSNPDEPKKVTEHKDIEDKGQTITFKEKPEEPEKPETPPTPEKPNRPSDSPKTGDSTNVMAFIVMLLASAGGLAGTYLYKRRKMKKS